MQCTMEIIKTCELCLEQITKTEDFENFNYDEKQYLTILKNLEISVSRDARICSNCVNISHLTYNFKTSCLTNNDHLKILIHPSFNDKLILEEVIVKKTKSQFKNEEKVCRFCLNFSEVNSLMEINLEQNVVLKDMLERCLPEIDTNIVENPLICYICNKLLKKVYNFVSQCKDIEVLGKLDTKTDVIVNENTSTVTIKNYNENIKESFVKEENCDGMKNPELQIKSEDFDIDEDIKDPINESSSIEKTYVKPKPHGTIKEKKFHCDISSYQTSLKCHLKEHYIIHKDPSEVYLFKCNYCPFATKWKSCLARHTMRHKNPSETPNKEWKQPATSNQNLKEGGQHNPVEEKDVKPKPDGTIKEKKFLCNICSYRANKNEHLQRHSLIHKELSEVTLFKCDYCPFATKWKHGLIAHARRHKNFSVLAKFKCDDCPYKTDQKSHIVRHALVHKVLSEVNMFKCEVCPFQTKYKKSILLHKKKMHQVAQCEVIFNEITSTVTIENYDENINESFVKEENCDGMKNPELQIKSDDFDIVEDIKDPINESNSIDRRDAKPKPHGIIKEKKFRCDICSYQTTISTHLKQHYLIHKEPSEVNLFKCDYCPFATKLKYGIIAHTRRHKNFSVLAKFKCNDCPYKTDKKSHLVRHALVHKNPLDVNMFKCEVCPFQTKYKNSILLHKKKIHQVSQCEVIFKEITSTEKNNLTEHTMCHKNPSEMLNKECKQPTKSNQNLKEVIQHNPVEEKDVKPKPHDMIKEKKFLCNTCSYRTHKNDLLKQHSLIHKELSEVNLFKCHYCPYATKWKRCLTKHTIRRHETMFKCEVCPFQTKNKKSILLHKKKMHQVSQCEVIFNEITSTVTIENYDENINESFVKEENCDGMKNPELQIKSKDFDIVEDIKDPINESNSVEKKKVKPKPHGTIKEKIFRCDICSYQATLKGRLKEHYIIHKDSSEVNLFKCDYCPFATKWKNYLIPHTMRHKNPSEMPNKEWKQPAKSNQNLKEVRQHNPVAEKDVKPKPLGVIKETKFLCDICSYQTNRNDHFKLHNLIHKEPSEVNLFKCDYYPFASRWKSHLSAQTIRHKNLSVLAKFNCNDCPYKTDKRKHMVTHVLVHKDPSKLNIFKCEVCPFQTKYKRSLRLHKKKIHQVEIYTCDKCTYESKFKNCYTKHLRYHEEWKQRAKSSQNLRKVIQYKCNKCSYIATRKYMLIKHQIMVHKDPSEQQGT